MTTDVTITSARGQDFPYASANWGASVYGHGFSSYYNGNIGGCDPNPYYLQSAELLAFGLVENDVPSVGIKAPAVILVVSADIGDSGSATFTPLGGSSAVLNFSDAVRLEPSTDSSDYHPDYAYIWSVDNADNYFVFDAFTPTDVAFAFSPTIEVSPDEIDLLALGTQQFTATVSDGSAFTWQIGNPVDDTPGLGTLTNDGFYTAPPVMPDGYNFIPVCAVLDSDTSVYGTASVTVSQPVLTVYGAAAPSAVSIPIMLANPGNIKPKIYAPLDNRTIRSRG